MATKLTERASFFSATEQEMMMNAYEEYKTIIMANSNTVTAARARRNSVCVCVYAKEQEMIMNAYEEYKTIIMAKSNTVTAARARQKSVCGAVYAAISMY